MTVGKNAFRLLLLMGITCSCAGPSFAGVCEDVHDRLSIGQLIRARDVESINSELVKDSRNPFKHFVAGEALTSLGLYHQAEEQFETADQLEKDYVRSRFGQELSARHHTLRLLCPYLQKKHPDDPALIFYEASRDLAGLQLKQQDQSQVSFQPIINQLSEAARSANPWPGTFALLSMLEYNEALNAGSRTDSNSQKDAAQLMSLAIRHAGDELKRDPDNRLALKMRLLSLQKTGYAPERLEGILLDVLRVSPHDPEANALLARIYVEKKEYRSAIRPLLLGFLLKSNPSKRQDLYRAFEVVRVLQPGEVVNCARGLIGELGWNCDESKLICLEVSDILAAAGKPEQALVLLGAALREAPASFRPLLELRIGRISILTRRLDNACNYLNLASRDAFNSELSQKILSLRDRVASQKDNFHRDAAAQVKDLFVRREVR